MLIGPESDEEIPESAAKESPQLLRQRGLGVP